MKYNELKLHGEAYFPLELYQLNNMHPQYEMACHYHDNMELIYVHSGHLKVTFDKTSFVLKENDIALANPNTLHSAIPTECIYECIVFNYAFFLSLPLNGLENLVERIKTGDILVHNPAFVKNEEIYDKIHKIFNTMRAKEEGYRLQVTGEIYNLFSLIVKFKYYSEGISISGNADNKSLEKLKKVLSHMRKNFSLQLSLNELSDIAGMSEKYFCSFFKKMTNKTPVEYLILYRIECSAKMLLNTDIPVTEVAYSCGFNDLSYFIKTFKRQTGVTPGEFRKLR